MFRRKRVATAHGAFRARGEGQGAFGRPDSARSRVGPPLDGDRGGGGSRCGNAWAGWSGSAEGNGRRGVGDGCEARRRNANCRSERPAATTGSEAKLVCRGSEVTGR